jgi:hypothetical protein
MNRIFTITITNIKKNPQFYEEKEEYKKIIRNISFLTNPIKDEDLEKFILPADLNDII